MIFNVKFKTLPSLIYSAFVGVRTLKNFFPFLCSCSACCSESNTAIHTSFSQHKLEAILLKVTTRLSYLSLTNKFRVIRNDCWSFNNL